MFSFKDVIELTKFLSSIKNKTYILLASVIPTIAFFLMFKYLIDNQKANEKKDELYINTILSQTEAHNQQLYNQSEQFIKALERNTDVLLTLQDRIENSIITSAENNFNSIAEAEEELHLRRNKPKKHKK